MEGFLMQFIITLTDVEVKALLCVYIDPEAWTINAIKERARIAGDELVAAETARMLSDPDVTDIPADRDTIILGAPEPVFPDINERPSEQ